MVRVRRIAALSVAALLADASGARAEQTKAGRPPGPARRKALGEIEKRAP
jgi:hypothetical protein